MCDVIEKQLPVQGTYTARQGQYLAFIYYYAKLHRQPPAEADMQRYFQVSPPAVHQDDTELGEVRTDRKNRWTGPLAQAAVAPKVVARLGVRV